MKTIGKTLLTNRLELEFSLSSQQAASMVETLMQTIQQALIKGDKVTLPNIGTLQLRSRKSVTKIMFGKEVIIKDRRKLVVAMSRVLDVVVNNQIQAADNVRPEPSRGSFLYLSELKSIIKE